MSVDKKTLIRNFSRYAYLYDRYADIQRESAQELLKGIKDNGFTEILEIGCGTGNYTLLLKEKFKQAKIMALDISNKMIEVAQEKLKNKNIKFLVADGECLNLKAEFDLITSNASLQWFVDLNEALSNYKNMLKNNGLLYFSLFGPLTFLELNTVLNYLLKDTSIEANRFAPQERLKEILKQNFKAVKIKEIRYQETFSSLIGLFKKIKYSGIRGNGFGERTYFSQKLLAELEKVYLDKYKKILATYQIFLCRCQK